MSSIGIEIGGEHFEAAFQDHLAPRTCAAFRALLPWKQPIIHSRWSGEACWIPLGDFDLDVPAENPTSYPRPGELLFFPGGVSEAEVLLAYGASRFASKAGQLAGNPLLRITDGLDRLEAIGRRTLWEGALPISFST
jgi:hypothetical protein